MTLRVLCWNCRRAAASHQLWRYLAELTPDLALLQELSSVPEGLAASYEVRAATPRTRRGVPQRFQSVLMVRGQILERVPLQSGIDWVDAELDRFAGNLLAYRVVLPGEAPLVVVAVYSPAWPVARERLAGVELASVKLDQNPDIWVSDLVVAALRQQVGDKVEWIVGGDFNSCETFDSWKGGPRGNREWLNRMAALGLTECLRSHQGKLTPTFRRPGVAEPRSQIDHLFVTPGLAGRLRECSVGDRERVYGTGLSDHLPIIAEFATSGTAAV